MTRHIVVGILWGVLSVVLGVTTLYGQVQTTTAVVGTVRDTTRAVLPGVTVTIAHQVAPIPHPSI